MQTPYRVIFWGMGQIGSLTLRLALKRPEIQVVGAKVFSAHKHGKDIGELLGLEPAGVKATTSMQDILAMDADVVIYTGRLGDFDGDKFKVSSIDEEVIALLESGKSVITPSAFHNVTMTSWASEHRADGKRLQQACLKGGASLLGTGIHPTFISERLAVTTSKMLSKVDHVRTVEAVNFAGSPEDMWGGVQSLGFGLQPEEIHNDMPLAKFNTLYYRDMAGNMAHSLFGIDDMSDFRSEVEFVGVPAEKQLSLYDGRFVVEVGQVAAIHQQYRFYLGDHLFYTNDEFWWLGHRNVYLGDDMPLAENKDCLIDYFIEIEGKPANIRSRFKFEPNSLEGGPITTASAMLMLEAVPKVAGSQPGVLIDDTDLHYRLDHRIGDVS